jgi:hypothetical protein
MRSLCGDMSSREGESLNAVKEGGEFVEKFGEDSTT